MLLPRRLHDTVRDGTVTVAFRAWKRPTVRAGGTLHSPVGVLRIDAVDVIDPSEITDADARAAGAGSVSEVLASLRPGDDRRLHRIRFHRAGDDPRVALRADADLTDADRAAIDARLRRWDAASPTGPWTSTVLRLIADNPGTVSTDLAARAGEDDRLRFKRRVRQLKSLGLTESLGVGYRLSPRGRAYVDR